jgi:uracil-DNA glycosylase
MVDDYNALVAARKACRICVERSPGRIRSCSEYAFDPEIVSHWEQWLGHKNPKLLVVGQDFGNVAYFQRCSGRDEPGNQTNANLQRCLAAAGISVGDPPDLDPAAPVFMTNSILCVKEGRMDAPILASWVRSCTEAHLVPLLRYLRPPVVVGMGHRGWQAVRQAFALHDAPRQISRALASSWLAADGTRLFAVVHCGPLGLTNRGWPQQLADWQQIGAAVAGASPQSALTRDGPADTTTAPWEFEPTGLRAT